MIARACAAFLIFFASIVSSSAETKPGDAIPDIKKGDVVVVPLDGAVTDAQYIFLRRILKEAESAEASAFIIDMDTPGGALSAGVDILNLLFKATIPTYTWVNSNAGSAGALIALGTKHIYMAPVSAIGAAAPVSSGGAEIPETMNDKVVSYYSGYFRSAAEANGHNPELAEAFISKDKEVKIGDVVISKWGSLLTLSAQEAVREVDGRPVLAAGIADSIDELKEKAGLQGPTIEIEPSGFERIAQLITTFAPLFLLGGIIGAYIEFKSPGFGVAGFLAGLCFLIFFTGHYIAGLTGMEVFVVFVIGVLLVAFELFFFPGLFVFSALGTALMLGSLLFAMVDFFPGDPAIPDASALARPALNMAITMVLAVISVSVLARFLPDLPIFRRLMLASTASTGPSLPSDPRDVYILASSVGDIGITRSVLRPSGKAEFGAALVDVVSDGEFIDPGTRVQVIRVNGSEVVVEPI